MLARPTADPAHEGSPEEPQEDTRPSGRGRLQWLLAAVLVAAGIGFVGVGLDLFGADDEPRSTRPVSEPSVVETQQLVRPPQTDDKPSKEPKGEPLRPDPAAGVPSRVLVPALDIDAPVVGIGVTDGVLIPPDDPQTLGWWSAGARPGAHNGSALITGHTVSTGGGALDDLEQLKYGDQIRVRTGKGVVRYDVRMVTIYRKGRLADHAAHVFSQERLGRLVLITCEDWDGEKYLSNVVVIGRPNPIR
jgi:LPXTG-site transpeptidase (sortase) family protein